MPRLVIGTTPIQIAWANPKRKKWEIQFLPSSVIAGNTGQIFVKRGSAPAASLTSNTWDHVLTSGASVGDDTNDQLDKCPWLGDVWVISDTASQVVTTEERNVQES